MTTCRGIGKDSRCYKRSISRHSIHNSKKEKTMLRTFIVLGVGLIVGYHVANAQQTPPRDNKGLTTVKTQVVDLGPEIEGMAGRQLRLRILNVEPGGHIGLHSHKDRPTVFYFIRGTQTVIGEDGKEQVFRAGDTGGETQTTTHWHQNRGTEPVTFLAVDVFKTGN
jgi:quercetin dioxygenase-like cupin family protein